MARILEGIIVGLPSERTIIVEVTRRTPHPLYKKLLKRTKRYKCDVVNLEGLQLRQQVRMVETRPLSKDKHFRLQEVKKR